MCERVLPLSSCAGLIRWIPGVKGHAASVFRGQAWHDFLSYSIKATIETGRRHLSLLRVGICSCILSSCSDAGMETFTVTLEGGSPWGFSIQGGVDHRSPLRVGKVCTPVNRHSIDQVSAAWDEKPRSTILKSLVEASMVEEMSMRCYCYKCPNMWCLVLIVSELVWKGKLRPVHTCISKILMLFQKLFILGLSKLFHNSIANLTYNIQ